MACANITKSEDHDCEMEDDVHCSIMISVAVVALVISIVGFLGNILTILALPSVRKLRHAATWFVVNLAVTELIFCVTVLPMSAAHMIHLAITGDELFDERACRLFVFVRFVVIQAELFSIAAIAVNRCVLIAIPKQYPLLFSSKKTVIIILAIWTYSCFVMIFPLVEVFGRFDYNRCTHECDFGDDDRSKVARRVYLAAGFIVPCLIIIASYSYIFYKSSQSTRRMLAMKREGAPSEVSGPATGLRTRDMRIARTIAVIFIVFLICCSPVSLAHYYGSEGGIPTTLLLLHPLYWLQYCLNSFIYVLMNKQYREAYISYICIWWPRFQEIVDKWYQETPDDDTSTSGSAPNAKKISITSRSSTKKDSAPRKKSRDTPVPSPKGTPMKMRRLELIPPADRTRKGSKSPSLGDPHLSLESLTMKGIYKPLSSLKLNSTNPNNNS